VGFPRGAVSSPNTLDEDTGYVNLNATSPCSGLIASVHIAVFSRDNRIRLPPMSISVFRTQYVNGNGNLVTLARISSPQKLPVDNITQNSFFTGDNNLISLQLTLNPDSYIMISKGDVLSFELGEIDEGDEVRPLSGLPQGRNDRVRLIAERLVGFDNQLIGSIFGPSLGTPPVISATVGTPPPPNNSPATPAATISPNEPRLNEEMTDDRSQETDTDPITIVAIVAPAIALALIAIAATVVVVGAVLKCKRKRTAS
jgi:hypothetical protein